MKSLIIFDLDGTLAESKSDLDDEIGEASGPVARNRRVAIISGGAWAQFEKQVLAFLPRDERLKRLSLLPTCGTKFYRFDGAWKKLYSEDFSVNEKKTIIDAINKSVPEAGFEVEKHWGLDRGSRQPNHFLRAGSAGAAGGKGQMGSRLRQAQEIKAILAPMIPKFSIQLGGATSIDVTRPGIDKAYGVRKLHETLGIAIADMIFVGDAIFPGGND